jgi:hypothetical protein
MNVKTVLSVLTRALVLGMIVFSSITYIPKKNVELRNRLVISALVVILYALIDYFGGFLKKVKAFLCKLLCECDNDKDIDGDIDDEL